MGHDDSTRRVVRSPPDNGFHGQPARALRHYHEALELAEKSGEPQLLFPCYDGLATLYLDADDGELAQRYMARARDTCDRAGLDPDALIVLPYLA